MSEGLHVPRRVWMRRNPSDLVQPDPPLRQRHGSIGASERGHDPMMTDRAPTGRPFGDRPGTRCPYTRAVPDTAVTLAAIRETRGLLGDRIHRTPMLSSATAARFVEAATGAALADGRLYLKAEHLQKTGSFKVRAALARISSLTADERARGAITISAGNAGQAYAWAGAQAGVPVTVVMPARRRRVEGRRLPRDTAPRSCSTARTSASRWPHLDALRRERGLTLVHPYDDPEVLLGNGSCGLEILEDLPDVDVVVLGIGGGGLIGGVATAIKESRPSVRIYGVEPVGSEAMTRAWRPASPCPSRPSSVADGLGAPSAGHLALGVVQRYVEEVVLIDDPTILAGLRFGVERLKQVLEPAGAAALAAVLTGAIPLRSGDRVCVILSGGNVAVERLGELLAAAAPLPGQA